MNLQTILGEMPKDRFVREYFQRMPFSLPGGARDCRELGNWSTWDQILRQPEADVMIVREGQQFAECRPATGEEGQRLLAEGFTLLVRSTS